MELRPQLNPREVDSALVNLLEQAFARLSSEAPVEVAADLSVTLGRRVDAGDLEGWSASIDPDEAAQLLAMPPKHELRTLNATRDELIEITRRWLPTSPDWDDEHEAWWMAVFDANVPHPEGSSLGFYPPDGADADDWDPTPEQVVDLALAYRAIEL